MPANPNPTVASLRAAVANTTQGEWTGSPHFWGAEVHILDSDGFVLSLIMRNEGSRLFEEIGEQAIKNAKFIALAHNELPALLDYVERLEAENKQLQDLCSLAAEFCEEWTPLGTENPLLEDLKQAALGGSGRADGEAG